MVGAEIDKDMAYAALPQCQCSTLTGTWVSQTSQRASKKAKDAV
jgi:hypothetical protein